ncbi:PAS domain S-box-containing protein [Noviherbaspirillum humi]|uniref:histidine kinase n=1 Tax=Noviherbaspirillum humi TaxID=1688639 RepID=A0A239EVP1_9BURK|nr:PAS domain S-box protein [Noviherbaspirillum humi]SNS48348.1 PAS domain S-box-containing protein [Noviherbaspirillum humi]
MPSLDKLTFEQRFRLVSDQLQDRALVTLDIGGTIVDWTAGAQAMFGWSAAEAVGKPFTLLFTPDDIAAGIPALQCQAAREAGRTHGLRWHVRKDGSRFLADGSLTALKLEDGSVAGFAKVFVAATTALQLQESEAKFKAMVNATPHMVWSALADGSGDYFNERMIRFAGVPADALKGDRWLMLVHPDDRARAENAWREAIRAGRPLSHEFRFRDASGDYRWVLCRGEPVRDDAGQIVRWMGTNTDIHEQKAAQAQLAESEELFRSLATASAQVIWRADADGKVIRDSVSARAFTGQSVEKWQGDGWLDVIHPDDRERANAVWMISVAEGSDYENEFRVRHLSGQYRWAAARGVPIRDRDGAIREWIGTISDITEKKQTELALREARLRLEATLAAGDVGTYAWDVRTDRVFADANTVKLHGLAPECAKGAPAQAYFASVHPEDLDEVRQRIEQAIAGRQPFQALYRVRLPDGSQRHIHSRGNVGAAPGSDSLWLSGVAIDVTTLQETEEALRNREERYQALFNTIEEGFYIIELIYDETGTAVDYRFLEANPAAGKINGLHNVVGKTLRSIFASPRMEWVERYGQVARTGQPMRFVDYSPTLGRWFDVSVSRLGSEPGRQVALLFSDITDRKRSEEQLQRLAADLSQANRRQGEFLATLAHELRNPLAPLRTGLDLVSMTMQPPEPIARVHAMMSRQVDHLVHLVDDLLDLARVNSGKIVLKRSRQPLADVIQAAVEVGQPLMREKGHEFILRLPDEPVWMDVDRNRLSQVISNLLTNSAKYTPPGGRIMLALEREGGMAVIRVTDNGIGLAADDVPRVFDMFTQVGRGLGHSQGGLGIGLNLVKRLTEKHGGTVSVSSPGLGQGSTFTLRLPVEQRGTDGADLDVQAPSGAVGATEPLSIVIADDNRDAVEVLRQLLELNGHNVAAAYDGEAALAAIRQSQPDLALLDIGMPGLNGYEVARAVRNDAGLQNTALVAVTGWGSAEDRARSSEAGFDHHLAKPVSYDMLLQLIAQVGAR